MFETKSSNLFRNLVVAITLGLLLTIFPAFGQPKSVIEDDNNLVFELENIELQGENPLSEREVSRIVDRYISKPLTIEDLNLAAKDFENVLADKGYSFYRVILPPQNLDNAEVTMEVIRLDVEKVVVTGNAYFSDQNIRRSMPVIASGKSPNTSKITNALLLAESNPAKNIKVVFCVERSRKPWLPILRSVIENRMKLLCGQIIPATGSPATAVWGCNTTKETYGGGIISFL